MRTAYAPWWDASGRIRAPVDVIAEPVFPDDGVGWDYLRERRRLYQLRRHERDRIPRSSVPLAWLLIFLLLLAAAGGVWWLVHSGKLSLDTLFPTAEARVDGYAPRYVWSAPPATVTPPLAVWAERTEDCLRREFALSTRHGEHGCFAGSNGQVHCTSKSYEETAEYCRAKANAAGRPERWK